MSRCKVCDYSPTTRSEFHAGLSLDYRPNTHLKPDRREGGYLCSACYSAIGDDLRETTDETDLDFNARSALTEWDNE